VQVGITTTETSNILIMELILKQIDVRGKGLFSQKHTGVRAKNYPILQERADTPGIALKKLFE
jgi:hypothetical protein